jgi:hypothetical protein
VPFALEVTGERTQGRQLAHERTALHLLHAPRGQERAHVERFQSNDGADARRFAQVGGQKKQKLPQVARISLDGFRRETALLAERRQPAHRFLARIGCSG